MHDVGAADYGTALPRVRDVPDGGWSATTTGMVDDHDPQARAIAYGHVEYRIPYAQAARAGQHGCADHWLGGVGKGG